MPNIWFDVTTIVNWRRPAVGIVRVEAECFKYLSTPQKPEVRFCHFDKSTKSYLEISADAIREIMRKWDAPLRPEAAPVPPSAARRLKDFTRHSIEKMPGILREPTLSLARETLTLIGRIKNRLVHGRRQGPADSSPPPFRHGDVYVSSGLDWAHKDLPYLHSLKTALGLKVILFCYDLIPVLFPHLCVGETAAIFTQYFVDVAKCADQVFCISQLTRRDLQALVRKTGAPEPLMPIITLGSNLPAIDGGNPSPEIQQVINQKFLLYVSSMEPRKNHEVIYRAMTRLVDQGRTDLPLIVFVGMSGGSGMRDFFNDLRFDLRVQNRFRLLDRVTDSDLGMLYQKAYFTLYPSLYEGWGLPLAESLAYGKFCLASNSSSLPEVGGSLVEYIDPWETNRWAERIAYYLDHPEEVVRRESLIREQYVPPSWEDTGKTLYESAVALLNSSAILRRVDDGELH